MPEPADQPTPPSPAPEPVQPHPSQPFPKLDQMEPDAIVVLACPLPAWVARGMRPFLGRLLEAAAGITKEDPMAINFTAVHATFAVVSNVIDADSKHVQQAEAEGVDMRQNRVMMGADGSCTMIRRSLQGQTHPGSDLFHLDASESAAWFGVQVNALELEGSAVLGTLCRVVVMNTDLDDDGKREFVERFLQTVVEMTRAPNVGGQPIEWLPSGEALRLNPFH